MYRMKVGQHLITYFENLNNNIFAKLRGLLARIGTMYQGPYITIEGKFLKSKAGFLYTV